MSDYLLITLEDESAHEAESPKRTAEIIEARAAFADELRRQGHLADAGRFRPSRDGKRVRHGGQRVEVHDGPFAEEGKALAGYHVIRAASLDEAAAIAKRCPTLASDEIEVRPVMKGSIPIAKEDHSGKVFGCAVLGSASTEDGWIEVMDRIDAESGDDFPKGLSLGGVRLQPPRTGRRVATRAERRTDFDGPFLESKEVIGGIFFVRMASIEDAVRWASGTHFVAHGPLEIRELWRT